jgi:hypothetical protein
MALDTRENVKAALNIGDTDSDAQIDALLEPISAMIEREAGRDFSSASVTERHMGGEPTINLRRWPVTSITTVTDKVTGEALASDQYALEASTGLLRRLPIGSQWARAFGVQTFHLRENSPVLRWEITYIGGPSATPEDIKLALYLSVGASLSRSDGAGGGGMTGLQSERDGDYAYTRAQPSQQSGAAFSGLPPAASAILASYKAGVFI